MTDGSAAENRFSWAFRNQITPHPTEVKTEVKPSPYDYFAITQDEADVIVKSFVSVGGVEKWKQKQPYLYKLGVEKEVCLVGGEVDPSKSYAIKRASNEEYRTKFPSQEMLREKKALNGRRSFAASLIVEEKGGPYIVTRYVEGTQPTDEEVIEFQKQNPSSITDTNNIVKNPVVGIVLLDIDDFRY